MTAVMEFEDLPVRVREREMLSMIGKMARGEVLAADVEVDADLRQLAYLASLARNRVRCGGERLSTFYRDAMVRLGAPDMAAGQGSPDPLKSVLGAKYSLDAGKIRAEADLHI